MQLPPIPVYYNINPSGIIQTAGVGPHQNIMIPSTGSSGGQATQVPSSIYYPGVYPGTNRTKFKFRLFELYFSF